MKWILVLSVALLSQACVNHTELARQSVESTVLHSSIINISYRSLKGYPGNVVCGEFSTKRSAKDDSFRPFIYRATQADLHPTEEDITVFCSKDPTMSLYGMSGINFTDTYKAALFIIKDDYARLGAALEQYEVDNFGLPKTNQGIAALIQASKISPVPRRFREGGYLDEIPLDPWETPYIYTGPGLSGGVKGQFRLETLGADGKTGGINENADVASEHMKYINHLENL